MTQINLLPWRAQVREQRKREFFILLGIGLTLSFLTIVIIHVLNSARLTYQIKRNDYLQSEIATLDQRIAELKGMQDKKEGLLTRMAIVQQLQENRLLVVHLFDELVRLIPEGVFLVSVKREGNLISLQGRAQSNTQVSLFMRNLEASSWYQQPILKEIATDEQQDKFSSSFLLQVFPKMPMERNKSHAKEY